MPGCFACAHRGLSAEQPENTLASFQAAAKAGFGAFEMDLRTTRDGEVVVLHDAGLERTTNGHGKVADMAYDEMRSYRTPAGPVPRLDDLFAAMEGWSGLWNLEVKATSAVGPAIDLVEHHGLAPRVVFSSFDPKPLGIARDQAPAMARALLIGGDPEPDELRVARELGCGWINADHDALTPQVVADLRAQKFRVAAYTVNDPARAKTLAQMGVECVITDSRKVLQALGTAAPATFA